MTASNPGIIITAVMLSGFAGALLRGQRDARAPQKIINKVPSLLRQTRAIKGMGGGGLSGVIREVGCNDPASLIASLYGL